MATAGSRMTDELIPFPARAGAADLTATRESVERIAERLSAGSCPPDADFDQFLMEPLRAVSPQHWTPLPVVLRAAEWLDEYRIRTVIDIGSGAGKFCVGAALACHCHFTGLEQRTRLVAGARALAQTFNVESRVHFIHGKLGAARLPATDAFYLYNPFEENRLTQPERIDDEVELSAERETNDLRLLRELLEMVRAGTYVMTY
ncbi:MAG: ribosomal protein methyltransferase, partial [Pseudomonadota bacterium]